MNVKPETKIAMNVEFDFLLDYEDTSSALFVTRVEFRNAESGETISFATSRDEGLPAFDEMLISIIETMYANMQTAFFCPSSPSYQKLICLDLQESEQIYKTLKTFEAKMERMNRKYGTCDTLQSYLTRLVTIFGVDRVDVTHLTGAFQTKSVSFDVPEDGNVFEFFNACVWRNKRFVAQKLS